MEHEVKKTYVKWKQVKDYPLYFISNTGILRRGNRILTPITNDTNNRQYFQLVNDNPKKFGRYCIHILVWEAFGDKDREKGKRKYEIHHKDFNYLNNHIDNLELLTRSEHLSRHGNWKGIVKTNKNK